MDTVLAVGMEDGRKARFMCINPEAKEGRAFFELQISPGNNIRFLVAAPFYNEEVSFLHRYGFNDFLDKLDQAGFSDVLDLERENMCR
ncbi:hypothetical protein HMSSN036_40560 [Paenibacillus macerans]|nr:hypothetical protein HMSSN036_40560 [Paenibacillus macerans]